jgi:hypothetical protein
MMTVVIGTIRCSSGSRATLSPWTDERTEIAA